MDLSTTPVPIREPAPGPSDHDATSQEHYDAVVLGGGFCGSVAALLLKRAQPQRRILLVERNEQTGHKVGEATVEVSAYFLMHVLGIREHLQRRHLPKHGLRFWFTDGENRALQQMSEIGPHAPPDLQTFQLDRSVLDEHLIELARQAGVEIRRPCTIRGVEQGWPRSHVRLQSEDSPEQQVSTRWLLDASGRAAFLARRQKLLSKHEEHRTSAVWGRWQGVRDLDEDPEWQPRSDGGLPSVVAKRRLATNHFCGRGWWCWVIPLACGKTSIGLVWDRDLFSLPGSGDPRPRMEAFLRRQDGLRELLEEAVLDEEDSHSYSHLPYGSSRFVGAGWALLGDAGMFLDPLYSPGLDHASISTLVAVRLVTEDWKSGEDSGSPSELEAQLALYDRRLADSYRRWMEALYLGKYRLLGDAELVTCAFLVDTALYYLGVVTPAYRNREALHNPVFGLEVPQARFAYRSIRAFNRRLQHLAARRLQLGLYGRRNVGWRPRMLSLGLGVRAVPPLLQGIWYWLRLEGSTALHSLRPRRTPSQVAGTEAALPDQSATRRTAVR